MSAAPHTKLQAGPGELLPCPSCGKPPGQKVGPPSLARCVTEGCPGKNLAAFTLAEWNAHALPDKAPEMLALADDIERQAAPYNREEKEDVMPVRLTATTIDELVEFIRIAATRDDAGVRALADIAIERQRQISKEGWTLEHDDGHTEGALPSAALCYVYASIFGADGWILGYWPWDQKWWKPRDNRRNLVKAGALIVAEIERMDRLAVLESGSAKP